MEELIFRLHLDILEWFFLPEITEDEDLVHKKILNFAAWFGKTITDIIAQFLTFLDLKIPETETAIEKEQNSHVKLRRQMSYAKRII